MDKEIIKVKNQNGEVVNAEVVLAFEYNNKKFVIYTFNEEDENGMIILHASLLDDSKEDAKKLAKLIKGTLAYVNLIPYNSVDENKYKRSDRNRKNNSLCIF